MAKTGTSHTPVSLLPVIPINGSEERAGGSTIPAQSRPDDHHAHDEPESKPLPAPDLAITAAEDRKALDLLFSETRKMQSAFPHTKFSSEVVNPENGGDQVWARKVLAQVAAAEMPDFVLYMRAKLGLLDKNALGKLPARPPTVHSGPRSLALIEEWAKDWHRNAPDRVRWQQQQSAAEAKRQAFDQAAVKQYKAGLELEVQAR